MNANKPFLTLLNALGIDTARARSISIVLDRGGVPLVTVEYLSLNGAEVEIDVAEYKVERIGDKQEGG